MDDPAALFITLGALFLAGLAADVAGRGTRLPRVTLLILIGIAAGPSGLGLITDGAADWFEVASIAALALVAFVLGNALTVANLAAHGREILVVTTAIVTATLAIMTAGLTALGLDPGLALILAAIGTATAPAATLDILTQARATGPFADRIKGIVAIDDAWGLIVFSIVLVVVAATGGNGAETPENMSPLAHGAYDIGGAFAVGLLTGLPAAYLTGRLRPGEPMQAEALGVVFLTAGLASWLGVSVLLSGITAGAVVANLARHHERAFHEIEHVEWPFMLIFFLLAGATLEIEHLPELGLLGLGFVVLRTVARLAGGWAGASLAGLPRVERHWMGPALLPQAGVAIGMALVAGETFPDWRETILTLTVGTTVLFELVGPPATMLAIRRVRAVAEADSGAQTPGPAPGSRNP